MSNSGSVVILLLACCAIAGWYAGRSRLGHKRLRFQGREPIPLDSIYETFYASSGLEESEVIKAWLLLANTLKLDAARLRPTDEFRTDYAPVRGFPTEDEQVDLEDVLRTRAASIGSELQAGDIRTLDDFIRFMVPAHKKDG